MGSGYGGTKITVLGNIEKSIFQNIAIITIIANKTQHNTLH